MSSIADLEKEFDFAYDSGVLTINEHLYPIRTITRVEFNVGWGDSPYSVYLWIEGQTAKEEHTFHKQFLPLFRTFLAEWKQQFAAPK